MPKRQPKIAIVGAGLAGLSCAYYLEQKGYHPHIYEKNTKPGGRIQTDRTQGYLLDHGFQIVWSNYEEINRIFYKKELQLKAIHSGAKIWYKNDWIHLDNPIKHPSALLNKTCSLFNTSDMFKLIKLYLAGFTNFSTDLNISTMEFLEKRGISKELIGGLLKPFFGGVFLDPLLDTQAKTFLRIAQYFATGYACLPAGGMAVIPHTLVSKLKKTTLHYNQTVQSIEKGYLEFTSGKKAFADAIVIATDGMQARALIPTLPTLAMQETKTVYMTIPTHYLQPQPLLYLNGMQTGPINHLLFLNLIQPSYAPSNYFLVSSSIIDPYWLRHTQVVQAVQQQLADWFNVPSEHWQHLQTYHIPYALPEQSSPPPLAHQYRIPATFPLYICGELIDDPSSNGALYSGRKAAEYLHKTIR